MDVNSIPTHDISAYSNIHNYFMVKAMSNWYYCRNGQQIGPISMTELKEAIERGDIDGDTFVWQEGMSEWVKIPKLPHRISPALMPPPLPASAKNATHPLKQFADAMFDAIRGKRSQ